MEDKIEKSRFNGLKRELMKMYPEYGKRFLEEFEEKLGNVYTYKDASMLIFKMFKEPEYSSMSLMQKINLGFLCPDHEFKSRLTENIYETLCEVFDFSEEYSRLHQLLSRAAWK